MSGPGVIPPEESLSCARHGAVQKRFSGQTVSGKRAPTLAGFHDPLGGPMPDSRLTPDGHVINEDGPADDAES